MTIARVIRKNCTYVGRADGPVAGVNCDRPSKMLTAGGELLHVRCRRSDPNLCEPCSETYRRNVGFIARTGVLKPGRTLFLTLTAPGERQHFLPSGKPCRCTPVGGVDLATWNGRAVDRWNDLSRALARAWGVDRFEYFKAVEVQERGALHLHVMIRLDRPIRWRLASVRALAIRHGYGHSVDLEDLGDGGPHRENPAADRAAWYCAKYVTKACSARHSAPFVHRLTGEVGPGRWRTWSASRNWSTTMASLHEAQAAFMLGTAGGPSPERSEGSTAPAPPGAVLTPNPTITHGDHPPWPEPGSSKLM